MKKEIVEKISKLLEENDIEWATLNLYIKERHKCLLIPEEKWKSVTDALYNEVGSEGWQTEWDY